MSAEPFDEFIHPTFTTSAVVVVRLLLAAVLGPPIGFEAQAPTPRREAGLRTRLAAAIADRPAFC